MDRKEKIYLYINSQEYIPLTFEELRIVLDVPKEDEEELKLILDELMLSGKIFLSKKGRYAPCEKNKLKAGTIRFSSRGKFAFVTPTEGEDIYIAPGDSENAIDGDLVLVKLTKSNTKPEGFVTKILERKNTRLTAVLTDDFVAIADNPRIPNKILLTDVMTAEKGSRVLLEITDYHQNGKLSGHVISVLGDAGDAKTLVEAIIFENGIQQNFRNDTLAFAESIPKNIEITNFPERTDLTEDVLFTIDGENARDFDDAVSLKILENGNYSLGVHIADVTHYVRENSPIDEDAKERGTSVYLTNKVIPMLPFELSNGICSLNPGVNRLALSVIMEVDKSGEVIKHILTKSIIRSKYRLTYTEVAKIFEEDKELTEKYRDITSILSDMHSLSKILTAKRQKRGSINFDFPESVVILDDKGYPKNIQKEERNDAHKMIEEFMLLANETVAEYAFWADLPFVYRVHEEPKGAKIEDFRKFIGNFGLIIKGREVKPRDLQDILDRIDGTDYQQLISTYMLRSLMKAEYNPVCLGHFGLAAKYYCHFTSPIRRYPDLMIHRILKDFLDGKDISKHRRSVYEVSETSSISERCAELCERQVEDLYKALYISSYIGAQFPAKVSGITSFGIFAELENSIEGMIRLETISDDYYEFDEANKVLVGKRHKKTYKIGDDIKIEVLAADILSRQIDFGLASGRQKRFSGRGSRYSGKSHIKYKRGKRNGKI